MIDARVSPSGDSAACFRIATVTSPTFQPAPAVVTTSALPIDVM